MVNIKLHQLRISYMAPDTISLADYLVTDTSEECEDGADKETVDLNQTETKPKVLGDLNKENGLLTPATNSSAADAGVEPASDGAGRVIRREQAVGI